MGTLDRIAGYFFTVPHKSPVVEKPMIAQSGVAGKKPAMLAGDYVKTPEQRSSASVGKAIYQKCIGDPIIHALFPRSK